MLKFLETNKSTYHAPFGFSPQSHLVHLRSNKSYGTQVSTHELDYTHAPSLHNLYFPKQFVCRVVALHETADAGPTTNLWAQERYLVTLALVLCKREKSLTQFCINTLWFRTRPKCPQDASQMSSSFFPDVSQMPPRYLQHASQMLPRCFPDASRMLLGDCHMAGLPNGRFAP